MSNPISIVAVGPDDDAEEAAWLAALERTLKKRAFCLGPEVESFEQQVQERLGVSHTFGVSNGTDALILALQAVGVGRGDEVLVPAYSFFASASAVAQLGAIPRFVDVEPRTLTADGKTLTDAITSATKAVMVVHLYGQASYNLDSLLQECKERGLPLVEDTAQAFGVRYTPAGGTPQSLGSFGIGTFSFYPTKNLGAPGDAGMVLTQNAEWAQRVKLLRVHGDSGGYNHTDLGWNARMDGFQAAVLSTRLKRLDVIQEARAKNATHYHSALEERGLIDRVRPLERTPGSEHCWHQFIVQVPERDRVRQELGERGIQSAIYYPATLPQQPALARFVQPGQAFPVSEKAAQEVLALPIHHRLDAADPSRVVDALAEILG